MNKLNVEKNNYIDITEKIISYKNSVNFKSGNVFNRKYFVDKNGNKYNVDGKNVIFEPTKSEKNIANYLAKNFGGNIYLNPKVNFPEKIESSDYLWKNETWDLKNIGVNATSLTRTIDNAIKKHKKQANNFILDITNCKIDKNILLYQAQKIFTTKGREWVKSIIIIDKYKLSGYYVRKKRS